MMKPCKYHKPKISKYCLLSGYDPPDKKILNQMIEDGLIVKI